MKKFLFSAVSRPAVSNARQETSQEESVIVRDLVMLGPASQGLQAAGFNPSGTVKVFPTEEEVGTDRMIIKVQGLPPNTEFTVLSSRIK